MGLGVVPARGGDGIAQGVGQAGQQGANRLRALICLERRIYFSSFFLQEQEAETRADAFQRVGKAVS